MLQARGSGFEGGGGGGNREGAGNIGITTTGSMPTAIGGGGNPSGLTGRSFQPSNTGPAGGTGTGTSGGGTNPNPFNAGGNYGNGASLILAAPTLLSAGTCRQH